MVAGASVGRRALFTYLLDSFARLYVPFTLLGGLILLAHDSCLLGRTTFLASYFCRLARLVLPLTGTIAP